MNPVTMVAGRAAVGMAEAGGTPTGMSLLSDYFGRDRRATAFGIWYISSGIGFALALFVGGWIVQHHDWRWAFVAAGIPGLVLAPLLWLTVREPRRGAQDGIALRAAATATGTASGTTAHAPLRQRLGLLFTRPGLGLCIAAITCIAAGIYGMSTWLATFLIDSHGFTIAGSGMTVAIAYGILGSIGGLGAGWGADWLNRRRGGFDPAHTARLGAVIPMVAALAGLGAVGAATAPRSIGCIMLAGLFSASYNGPIYAVIVTQAGPDLRGLAVSAVQMSANLIGVGAGAWMIGKVSDLVSGRNGVAWGIGTAMLFCLAGGVLLLMAARQISQNPDPEPVP